MAIKRMESKRKISNEMMWKRDGLTSFLGRHGATGTDREGRFPSMRFSLFSNVINRASFVLISCLMIVSVLGTGRGGDGRIVSFSNFSTK